MFKTMLSPSKTKTRFLSRTQIGFQKSLTTQGDEREVIRCLDVGPATSKP